MSRIQAHRVEYKGIVFDSIFELETMKVIEKYFPLRSVLVHHSIDVRPASLWFPKQKWKIDFAIFQNKKPFLYLESKGFVTPDFKERVKNLAYLKPEVFEKLVVVTPMPQTIVRGFVGVNLRLLDSYLSKSDSLGLTEFVKRKLSEQPTDDDED